MTLRIENYNIEYKSIWDSFVSSSRNGTFLFYRDYMEYHSDKFKDHSLLIYDKNKLIALLPANVSENILYSHQGLTYGGFILSEDTKTAQTIDIFDALINYSRTNNITKILYKTIPHIYHRYPSEDDLYVLFRNEAVLLGRSISSVIDQSNRIKYSQLRKRQIQRANNLNLKVVESLSLSDFWSILETNLKENHQTIPTHSLSEIKYLKELFPQNIKLFCTLSENEMLAGCLIFETETVAHAQYIAASVEGKESGALDLLFDHLISNEFNKKRFFDFGTSTENGGLYLNDGLISQKEGFGARGVVYDTYQLDLTEN